MSDRLKRFKELFEDVLDNSYKHLNDMQRKAVINKNGPLLILAGAGSGKTTVLVNRINYILNFGKLNEENINKYINDFNIKKLEELKKQENIDINELKEIFEDTSINPTSILAITFTNKAAKEMKERVEVLINKDISNMWIFTFHSACVRILRRYIDRIGYTNSFVIYDRADQITLMKECIKELNLNEKTFEAKGIISIVSDAKDKLITPKEFQKIHQDDFRMSKIASIYKLYQEKLKGNSALDFDDLIFKTVELLQNDKEVLDYYQNKFKYVLVDEYQDTNKAQYRLIGMLSGKYKNLCVVGDDDQSIYGWRGADISNILNFEKDFDNSKVIKLEQNYRSTTTILNSANEVIKNNISRKNKKLWSSKGEGDKLKLYRAEDEREESDFIAHRIEKEVKENERDYNDFSILYRTNAQSRAIEDALMKQNVPYRIYGGIKFYERKEIKDILAYLRVVQNPLDDISLKRIINVPKRGIGNKTVQKIEELALESGESFYSVLLDIEERTDISSRAANKLSTFATMISSFMAMKEIYNITDLIQKIIDNTGYIKVLEEVNDIESKTRIENIKEFISVAVEFEQSSDIKDLETFLATISLSTDIDKLDESAKAVSLMTLHSAKGLEFPIVFLAGLEEGIFPVTRAMFDETQLEEERRLCYVGITRAKETLYLTHAGRRTLYGKTNYSKKSRFLDEIPNGFIKNLNDANSLKRVRANEKYIKNFGPGIDYSQANSYKNEYKVKEEKFIENKDVESGSKIKHPTFGIGTVVSKKDKNVTIAFENKGIKVLNLDYVKLKVL
ncbi:DUF3553 domain-containing protein [Peptostreptococcaceae bacterium AGR-M142]